MPATSNPQTPDEGRAWGAAFFTIAAWGSAFTGIAIALEALGPGALALARFGTASITLAVIALFSPVRRIQRSDWPRLVGISMLGITAYHLMLNFGQQVVPPAVAALLIQTAPLFTAALAARFDGERIVRRQLVGIAVAATGTVLIVFGRGADIAFSTRALVIVGCALATSIYFVFGRPLIGRYGARTMTTWSIWIGTLPMLVFAPTLVAELKTAAAASVIATVYIGVVPAALAYITWNFAVGHLGAARVSVLLYTSPLVAMVTHYAWNGTLPTAVSLIGGALAIAGTYVATRKRRR